MAASMNMSVFWVVAPCSLVEFYRRFSGVPTRLHGAITQKTAVFSLVIYDLRAN
jgi:hypothetical protein